MATVKFPRTWTLLTALEVERGPDQRTHLIRVVDGGLEHSASEVGSTVGARSKAMLKAVQRSLVSQRLAHSVTL